MKQYDEPCPPHHVAFDLSKVVNVAGLVYVPRQDVCGGRVGDYRIYVSNDPGKWGAPVAEGHWPNTCEQQSVVFGQPCRGRYLRIVAENEVHAWTYVSVAEIDIVADWRT